MHRSVLHGSGIDASFDPCVLFAPVRDPAGEIVDFRYIDANRGAAAWIGVPLETLLGELLSERYHGSDRLAAAYAQVMETGEPLAVDEVPYLRTPGGLVSLDLRAVRIGDCLSVAWRDMSDRVRYEHALAESEAQFRLLAEHASDVVFRSDVDGVILWISPSVTAVLGWVPGDVMGRNIFEYVDSDSIEPMVRAREAVLRGETVESVECRLHSAQGAWRWMSARAEPVPDGESMLGAVVSLRDIHSEVTARRAFTTLSAGNAALLRAEDEDQLLGSMCETAVVHGGYLHAWFGRRVHDAERSVRMVASSVAHRDYAEQIAVSWGDGPTARGPAGAALRTSAVTLINDITRYPDFSPWQVAAHERGFRSAIGLPVSTDGATDGVLVVYAAEVDAFDARAVSLLEDLTGQIGYGLEKLRARASLDRALESAVDLLAAAVESRDPYTAGHQQRVATLSAAIGRELGLDPNRLAGLDYGATVHDIGKIATPIEILTRPGVLAHEETLLVRRHAVVGWEIASRFEWPWPINEMIHQHHERWDGSGYPQGLVGDDILLEARIIGVADTFEAMAFDRPYRQSTGLAKARRTIEEGAGKLFDPQVVAAFARVLDGGFSFDETSH